MSLSLELLSQPERVKYSAIFTVSYFQCNHVSRREAAILILDFSRRMK